MNYSRTVHEISSTISAWQDRRCSGYSFCKEHFGIIHMNRIDFLSGLLNAALYMAAGPLCGGS